PFWEEGWGEGGTAGTARSEPPHPFLHVQREPPLRCGEWARAVGMRSRHQLENIHNCFGGSARAPLRGAAARPIETALMNIAPKPTFVLNQRHLLGIEGLSREEILGLLDLAENFVELNRQIDKKQVSLRGRTLINLFFEVSTRTQASFELAGKRLGADVMNMSVGSSSMRKGETLIDTAITLN